MGLTTPGWMRPSVPLWQRLYLRPDPHQHGSLAVGRTAGGWVIGQMLRTNAADPIPHRAGFRTLWSDETDNGPGPLMHLRNGKGGGMTRSLCCSRTVLARTHSRGARMVQWQHVGLVNPRTPVRFRLRAPAKRTMNGGSPAFSPAVTMRGNVK